MRSSKKGEAVSSSFCLVSPLFYQKFSPQSHPDDINVLLPFRRVDSIPPDRSDLSGSAIFQFT